MEYIITVPCITTVVYTLIEIIKKCFGDNEKLTKFLPLIALVLGGLSGVVCFYFIPGVFEAQNVIMAIVIGAASGLAATGINQVVKQLTTKTEDTTSTTEATTSEDTTKKE